MYQPSIREKIFDRIARITLHLEELGWVIHHLEIEPESAKSATIKFAIFAEPGKNGIDLGAMDNGDFPKIVVGSQDAIRSMHDVFVSTGWTYEDKWSDLMDISIVLDTNKVL